MRIKRVVFMADLHCGHRIGLTPPRHQPKVSADAPPHMKKLAAEREAMWAWYASKITALSPIDILICNGDALEGKGLRSGGTELITADRIEQAQIAADVINYAKARSVYATFGTPYHVGADEDLELLTYDHVENFKKLESEGHYDVRGLQIACKHYIGNTSSPASRGTALANSQVKQMLWAIRDQQPLANLIVRSHIHRAFAIQDPALNFMALTTPALQGCGSKYGARQCDGLPVDFGFVTIDVESKTKWAVKFHIAPAEYARSSVTKL